MSGSGHIQKIFYMGGRVVTTIMLINLFSQFRQIIAAKILIKPFVFEEITNYFGARYGHRTYLNLILDTFLI